MRMTVTRMMVAVLLALTPLVLTAIYIFRWYAVKQLLICLVAAVIAEAIFTRLRSRPLELGNMSAVVTGVILGLSLPAAAPWYVGAIGSVVAMGIGKMVFGGLGMNIFNPAMVGRAFVMIAFAGDMAASGYLLAGSNVDVLTQATPLTLFKQSGQGTPLGMMVLGATNGSIGETSALACLLGGLFLCFRKVAAWEIPAGILIATTVIAGASDLLTPGGGWTIAHHLMGGALLFGAFFIATDPVSSPLTPKGKWLFGIGTGSLVMLLRLFSGYPEGMMFAILLMNAVTPLINRWTIPRPFGGV
ncbi:MAG: RnfABCDGE type electron transport complex subunit D [Desulfobacterales bacterium]|nr:RnfABCDGE type electron transport complex subunit D [Desulfobacterales bacterium]